MLQALHAGLATALAHHKPLQAPQPDLSAPHAGRSPPPTYPTCMPLHNSSILPVARPHWWDSPPPQKKKAVFPTLHLCRFFSVPTEDVVFFVIQIWLLLIQYTFKGTQSSRGLHPTVGGSLPQGFHGKTRIWLGIPVASLVLFGTETTMNLQDSLGEVLWTIEDGTAAKGGTRNGWSLPYAVTYISCFLRCEALCLMWQVLCLQSSCYSGCHLRCSPLLSTIVRFCGIRFSTLGFLCHGLPSK